MALNSESQHSCIRMAYQTPKKHFKQPRPTLNKSLAIMLRVKNKVTQRDGLFKVRIRVLRWKPINKLQPIEETRKVSNKGAGKVQNSDKEINFG